MKNPSDARARVLAAEPRAVLFDLLTALLDSGGAVGCSGRRCREGPPVARGVSAEHLRRRSLSAL